jgi:hypothetical protein
MVETYPEICGPGVVADDFRPSKKSYVNALEVELIVPLVLWRGIPTT